MAPVLGARPYRWRHVPHHARRAFTRSRRFRSDGRRKGQGGGRISWSRASCLSCLRVDGSEARVATSRVRSRARARASTFLDGAAVSCPGSDAVGVRTGDEPRADPVPGPRSRRSSTSVGATRHLVPIRPCRPHSPAARPAPGHQSVSADHARRTIQRVSPRKLAISPSQC